MTEVTTLLSQYSIESIILIIVIMAAAIRFLGELFDWCSKRLRTYFNVRDSEEEFKQEMRDALAKINKYQEDSKEDRLRLERKVDLLQERLQDSARAYIIDKYHHFKEIGAIDDMSLADLERRFMYYKDAGGDTFIDGLMSEIRELPHLSLVQLHDRRIQLYSNGGH